MLKCRSRCAPYANALLFTTLFAAGARAQTPATPDAPTPGQTSGKTTTLSLSANLVNLPVIVRDKKGALVQNLTKADFVLTVDGHAQTIRYFDRDQNLPLTLGLLVDTSESQRSVLDEERNASSTFLDSMLTPANTAANSTDAKTADRAFIVQFARQVELLQDLTASRPKLQAAVQQIGTESPSSRTSSDSDDNDSGGNARPHRGGGTTLYDAVFLSADELMKKQQGRKALVILSDGVDRNSKERLNSAIEAAQRADTIIYAIYFKGQEPQRDQQRGGGYPGGGGGRFPGGGGGYPGGGYPGGGGGYPGGGRNGGGNRGGGPPLENRVDGKKILEQMADETGGRFYEVKGKQKVTDIYNQIGEELRSQYRLGFTPDGSVLEDGYHKVDLEIPSQKNDYVQTRQGYYTGKQ
jgi:VWFA-related protein